MDLLPFEVLVFVRQLPNFFFVFSIKLQCEITKYFIVVFLNSLIWKFGMKNGPSKYVLVEKSNIYGIIWLESLKLKTYV